MSHLPLSLKHRPKSILGILGQESVRTGLSNAIDGDRVRQAYLFAGARGTGKTSTARALAKSLNCMIGVKTTPCMECDCCRSIQTGDDVDVIEIDGASNNGVDAIRALNKEVHFYPMRAKYRIYIVDEAHMLTKQAFNALLKTLEEPPSHVKFILCTTELGQIPKTIQSRCQLHTFHPIAQDVIEARLCEILKTEVYSHTKGFPKELAEMADGSMRDAINCLDQVINIGEQPLNSESLEKVFGRPKRSRVADLLKAIADGNPVKAMSSLRYLTARGFNEHGVIMALIAALQENLPKTLQQPERAEAVVNIIIELEAASRVIRLSDSPKALLEALLVRTTLNRRAR